MCMLCVCYSMDRINDLIYFKNEINGTNDKRETNRWMGRVMRGADGGCVGDMVRNEITHT